MRKSIFGILAITLLTLGAFQNCGKLGFATGGIDQGGFSSLFASGAGPVQFGDLTPSLAINSHPKDPRRGTSVVVTAIPQNLNAVSYSCASVAAPETILTSGALSADEMMFKLTVDRDVVCTFKGFNADLNQSVSLPFEIDVQCGAQIKNAVGACEDFVCHSYEEIRDPGAVPARTADGICYYQKVLDAVTAAPSDPAAPLDPDVAVQTTADPNFTSPAKIGAWTGSFTLNGPRTVKLAGAPDSAAPVVVDDLLLIGTFASDVTADPGVDYRAISAGVIANVKFKTIPVSLTKFVDGGVSSGAPIEVTSFAEVGHAQTLDLRGLDTGGTRESSTVFLRFE